MEEPSPSALPAPTVLSGGSPRRVVLRERPPAVVGLHLRTLKWLLTSPAMHVLVHQTDGSGKLELLWLTVFGLRSKVFLKSGPKTLQSTRREMKAQSLNCSADVTLNLDLKRITGAASLCQEPTNP